MLTFFFKLRLLVPSAMGIGTSTSVAKLFSILSNGGKINGKQFISKNTVERALETLVSGTDKILEMESSLSRGGYFKSSMSDSGYYHSGS